jgi:B12-binding domain/radical SAM domain protein
MGKKPNLILRIQNYNRVSLGAILGALPTQTMEKFHLVPWVSTGAAPEELKQAKTLITYSFMLPHAMEVGAEVKLLKAENPELELVCGGAQPTSAPQQSIDMGFDYVMVGEGEVAYGQFLEEWLVGGVERGVHRAAKAQVNLDLYPGFSSITEYLPPIEISRGCRCGCMFCGVPRLNAATVRHRSLAAIEGIVKEYFRLKPGRKRIKFLAPNAFAYGSHSGRADLNALYDLLEMLKRVGVPEINLGSFPSEVRPDYVTREVMELVTPYLSNKTIVMGVQSGSDRMLKKMNRGHTREQAINAISLLREFGFLPHVDFIIGNPSETVEEQVELVDFMEQMIKEYEIKVHMHAFTPLPATPWENQPQTPIDEQVKERIRRLERAGKLDGWWENHIGYYRGTQPKLAK